MTTSPVVREEHRHRAPARTAADVIVLSGLSKLYEPTPGWMRPFARTHIRQPVRALDGVDLTVREGEICAIVGPNGAGKTTIFRIIMGLTTATGGSGSVLGLDVATESERIRQVVGWMPSEDRSLLMRATALENLQLHGRLQGMPHRELRERIPEVLSAVGLTSHTHAMVVSMSAGMKARLRLARALLPRPRALILDEPTGAIDPIAAHTLLELITELVERDRLAVLISSHRLEEIEALSSRAVLLDGGRVRYAGDLDHLRTEWEKPRLEIAFTDASLAEVAAHNLRAQGIELTVTGANVVCEVGMRGTVGVVLSGLGSLTTAVQHVREIPMPLRDLIARVYRTGAS